MQCKTATNFFFEMENVYVFNIGSNCIHGKELLRKFYIPSKMIGNDLTLKQMFDICKS